MKKFFSDFKKFISRGNILDLAVGVIIGTSFSAIVTALVNSILMPLICSIFGADTVEGLAFYINGTAIQYGVFLQAIIDFLLIALVLFIILKVVMSAKGFTTRTFKSLPNRAERKQLKAEGVNLKNRKEVLIATKELRERNKPAPIPPKPTSEELLSQILEEIKKQNENIISHKTKNNEIVNENLNTKTSTTNKHK